MNRYQGGKNAASAVYLSLGTFKKIALGLIILMIGLMPINLGELASASVIDLTPTTPGLTEGNAILKNFSIHFSNRTNATLENYVTSQEKGDAIIQAINTILRGQDYYEPLEPLAEEEELEEEQEKQQQEESSSKSDSSNGGDSVLIPQPGDDPVFPPDAEPQPQPDGNGSEEDSSSDESESSVE